MKITEILVESQQLDEGPLLNKIGAGIGKAAGTVAKGIGAVAGGVVGAGKALAKGYQAGKATVGAAGDDTGTDPAGTDATEPAAGGTATTTPAAKTKPAAGGAAATSPTASGTAPAATNAPAAKTKSAVGGTPAPAAGGAAPAAGGTAYAQVKANIDKLDKKGKQRILQTLQKEVGAAPAATAKPAAGGAAPAAADPGAGAMGQMAGQLAKGGAAKPNTMANAPVSKTNKAKPGNPNATTPAAEPAAEPAAPTAGGGAFKQMAQGLGKKPAAATEPAADEPNYNTQTGVASPAQMKKNREIAKAEAPNGFDPKTGKPNPAPTAAPEKAAPGATTTTPSGEKVLANPVATVGTKRATNIGEPTFDKETGKPLPGQAINAIRKQAEYGSNTLGKIRKGMKAKAAAPAAQESIDADRRNIMGTSKPTKVREKVSESFSLFRKR
jgi:hypothetical protein